MICHMSSHATGQTQFGHVTFPRSHASEVPESQFVTHTTSHCVCTQDKHHADLNLVYSCGLCIKEGVKMDGWWCVLCKYIQSYLSFTICSLCCIGKTLKTFHMALASTGSQTQPQLSVHISHTRVKHTTNTTMNSCRCEEP